MRVKTLFAHENEEGRLAVRASDTFALFHIAAIQECVRYFLNTKGNYTWLNMGSASMQKCFQGIATRFFSAPNFSLVLLVPDIDGRPSLSDLRTKFGEAETEKLSGSLTAAGTSELEDDTYYPWLGMALSVLHAAEAPSMDVGLLECFSYFATGIMRWRAV